MEISQNLNENTTKSPKEQRERCLRKAFCFRKKTIRAFGKRASYYKNAFLKRALAVGFTHFERENLFFGDYVNFIPNEAIKRAKNEVNDGFRISDELKKQLDNWRQND